MNSQQEILLDLPEQLDSFFPTYPAKKKKVTRLCAICGDKAANWYYGVIACEACKVILKECLIKLF